MLRLLPPGTTRAPPQVKAERSEPKGSLDKGVQWESTAGSPLSAGPCPKGIPYVAKYIYTELGIGYRMLED